MSLSMFFESSSCLEIGPRCSSTEAPYSLTEKPWVTLTLTRWDVVWWFWRQALCSPAAFAVNGKIDSSNVRA